MALHSGFQSQNMKNFQKWGNGLADMHPETMWRKWSDCSQLGTFKMKYKVVISQIGEKCPAANNYAKPALFGGTIHEGH